MPATPLFVRRFLATEAAGGIVLVIAAFVAVAWASSPWDAAYSRVADELHVVVNDGLMAVFFLVVGLEIRRELVEGDRRAAVLPAIAAVGGMVLPAAIYLLVARDRGWGVPMATDIAFAVGVVTLLGRRVHASLRLFLLTLAIADDIGAILVIAIFYGGGVHPSIIGVVVAFVVPRRWTDRMTGALHPVSTFAIVPLFALVNGGIDVGAAAMTTVSWAVLAGLVIGKPLGITLFSWLAVRARLAVLPDGATWTGVFGIGALAGIGFTVSLFVADLAFDDGRGGAARTGILAASVVAALVGAAVLTRRPRPSAPPPAAPARPRPGAPASAPGGTG